MHSRWRRARSAGVPGRPGRWRRSNRRSTALELACQTAGPEGRVTLAQAEDALQKRALLVRPQGRSPLRHNLGLDQGHPGLRPGRLLVLPGRDAGGRGGPQVHRPPHGRAGLGGHRQRRPAGPGRGHRSRPGRRACGLARVPVCPGPGGHLPFAGAEVRRRQAVDRGRPAVTSASMGPTSLRPTCGPRPGATAVTTTPIADPVMSRPRS